MDSLQQYPMADTPSTHMVNTIKNQDTRPTVACSYCTKSFRGGERISNLRRHLKSVYAGRRFYCQWATCGQSMNRADDLRKHVRHAHLRRLEIKTCLWFSPGKICDMTHDSHESLKRHIHADHIIIQSTCLKDFNFD